jgi:hypothetical protein
MPRFQNRKARQQQNEEQKTSSSLQRTTAPAVPAQRVSTKTEDFLKNDQPIPGQNYVCLSFISPEEVVANKNVFMVHCFLRNLLNRFQFSEEPTMEELKYFKTEMFKHLESSGTDDKFRDFMAIYQDELEKKFYELNDYHTSIRGLKVRGVYDTYPEAKARSEEIRSLDKNFNVYVGQVGYWLPWDPSPTTIKDQEYQETELNTLVKKYNENLKLKDQHFQENIDYVREQAAKQAEKAKLEKENEKVQESSSTEESEEQKSSSDSLNEVDPWMKRKMEEQSNVDLVVEPADSTDSSVSEPADSNVSSVSEPADSSVEEHEDSNDSFTDDSSSQSSTDASNEGSSSN